MSAPPVAVAIPAEYLRLLGDRAWPSAPIVIYSSGAIPANQVGYRFDPQGGSLIGPQGWHEEWLVVGHDELLGDPIFIDTSTAVLPAYTAEHGQGSWETVLIADSAASLLDSLDIVDSVWGKRLPPDSARRALKRMHGAAKTDIAIEYWDSLIESFETIFEDDNE